MKYLKNLWKNKDNVVVLLPVGCAALFALGGGGFLALRRFVLPLYIVLCLYWAIRSIPKLLFSLLGAIALSFTFHFGYGSEIGDRNILFLFTLGCGYALASLGFWAVYSRKMLPALLRVIIPTFWVLGIALSNNWILNTNLEWKIVEGGVGLLIGLVCLIDIWGDWR